jgi:hypothetical protein
MASITFRNVVKRYGENLVIHDEKAVLWWMLAIR